MITSLENFHRKMETLSVNNSNATLALFKLALTDWDFHENQNRQISQIYQI